MLSASVAKPFGGLTNFRNSFPNKLYKPAGKWRFKFIAHFPFPNEVRDLCHYCSVGVWG